MSSQTSERRAAVIGWPVGHSRSPLIHGYWLKHYAIAGSYERIAVAPDELETFLRDLPGHGLVGCNVTVPHKENAARRARVDDPQARRLGSVNTLWLEEGQLCGTSTDGYGFLENLRVAAPQFERCADHRALVLGAGGAARPVVAALLSAGVGRIDIVNRTFERAQDLAAALGPAVAAAPWEEIGSLLPGTTLLVNTTSLGMKGSPPLAIDLAPLPKTAIVADIVYVPLETELLRQARLGGHACVDGLGMLLHQAVPGFEKWFGLRPEVTPELRALVVKDLVD